MNLIRGALKCEILLQSFKILEIMNSVTHADSTPPIHLVPMAPTRLLIPMCSIAFPTEKRGRKKDQSTYLRSSQ